MLASGADFRCLGAFADVTAVAALPPDFVVADEEITVGQAAQQFEVTILVLVLGDDHHAERGGDFGEALLVGDSGEFGVHLRPFLVLAHRSGFEVLLRGADHAGRETGRDGEATAFEVLEKFLGVFLFLIGRFEKDAGDLLVPLFLGYACEIGIPVARLRFACECREQILLGLGSFDAFHN